MEIKIIKPTLELEKKPHKIIKKLGPGKYMIKHPQDCECQLLHSVKHAPWITYDQMHGKLSCDHCGVVLDMPCPSVKQRGDIKTVKMDLAALADDLWVFQLKHEGCQAKVK